ncbi:MAG: VWA domain-containing protein [Bacteroidia bacterium]
MKILSQIMVTARIISCLTVTAQNPTTSEVKLNILNVDAKAFPQVSVTFTAADNNGIPFWNINKALVKEDGMNNNVSTIRQVAQSKPIYVSVVVDHSASMEDDPSQLFDKSGNPRFTLDKNDYMVVPDDYTMPIDNAKDGIKKFVSAFDSQKDYISITGFGSSVDKTLALTNNEQKINQFVDGIKAIGKTALYDGIITGLEQLNNVYGPRFMVVLTDGQDNMSKHNLNDVIEAAVKNNVPVYLIGLGEANQKTLQQIAEQTHGQFFFANTSTALQSIYATISQRMQSIYEFEYTSTNTTVGGKRELELNAEAKNKKVIGDKFIFETPEIVMAKVAKTNTEKPKTATIKSEQVPVVAMNEIPDQQISEQTFPPQAQSISTWIYLNLIIALLVVASIIIYKIKKRGRKVPA